MDVPVDLNTHACSLHQRSIVVDTHCDTTQRLLKPEWNIRERHEGGHVDIPRLIDGGVTAVFFAIWAPGPLEPGRGVEVARIQFGKIERCVAASADVLTLARTAGKIREAKNNRRIAILIGIEGGYLIEDSLNVLREYHERGAAYLTLTHGFHTSWADSSGIHEPLAPLHGGLTSFGRDVIREMNRLRMMVDVSHASDDTVRDVLEISTAPVIASHSSCRAVSAQRRNLSDDLIREIAARGGLMQINFSAGFVDPDFPPVDPKAMEKWWKSGDLTAKPLVDHVTPLSVLIDHFDHAMRLVGADHVGIGSDFDGVAALPEGMQDCSMLPNLAEALLRRGYSDENVAKVLGDNVLRVMDAIGVGER